MSENVEQEQVQQPVQNIIKLNKFIGGLQDLEKQVGDIEIIFGHEAEHEGKKIMKYGTVDFMMVEGALVITNKETVDSILEAEQKKGLQQATADFIQ